MIKTGGCACEAVRYELLHSPLIVHCCHCHYCQRETGTSFALNVLTEADAMKPIRGCTRSIRAPTKSGQGQIIFRCSGCQVSIWSTYALGRGQVRFVRAGTLDRANEIAPDIHIYTESK